MLRVKHIQTRDNDIEVIKKLFIEYANDLNENLCFQHFGKELEDPLYKYGPPKGSLLLALWNDEPAGCVALQSLKEQGICEMKRLYVKPAFRKHGIGKELVRIILKEAIEKDYNKMALDTLERLVAAIRLYEKYGFVNASAYYNNPLPGVVYMEKNLG